MTWKHLKENSEPHFYAIKIDRFFPAWLRSLLRKSIPIATIFFFLSSFGALPLDFSYADGLFFLSIFVYLLLVFLESFYRSMKNEGLYSRIPERILSESIALDYALSQILYETDEIDAVRALSESQVGAHILERSGITAEEFKQFISTNIIGELLSGMEDKE